MGRHRTVFVSGACLLTGAALWAQVGRGGAEWLTAQADAQRTSWVRADAKISVESLSSPGFALQWTSPMADAPPGSQGLAQGVSANGVTLFVPVSIVAGGANTVSMIDNDTGHVVWQRRLDDRPSPPEASCSGAPVAAGTRIVSLVPPPVPPPPAPRGRGAVGYRSLLGEPGEGVPVEPRAGGPGRAAGVPAARGAASQSAARGAAATASSGVIAPPNAGIPGAPGGGGPASGLGRPSGVAYAIGRDGALHVLGLQSGKDLQPPAPFLPADAEATDPIAVRTTLYAATTGECGAPAGVRSIDLDHPTTKAVTSWTTNGGPIVGNVAFTTDGTLLVAVGAGRKQPDGYTNAIVALDAATLTVKDWFSQGATEFVTGPTVFAHGDRQIVAAATKDGRIVLLDAASLGGPRHATPLLASRVLTAGASVATHAGLSTWQDADRWLLLSVSGRLSGATSNGPIASGGVAALKLSDRNGRLTLARSWTSHDMTSPGTPLVVNGVVFAVARGHRASRATPGGHARVYAYEGATGRPLWNSAETITSPASPRSFWSAMGQVYVGAVDGRVYTFGFPDERR